MLLLALGNYKEEVIVKTCALSPIIFNVYFQDALEKVRKDIAVGEK